ncbi:hypothetical protein UFOVP147_34 [uncultured Caudovirales phage]|uniref:Uncharacterized protein n=1 Tax=uncultured Caudovirales phage TaxID=2100421 RepID=A0A6J7W946_9CAUD|nr:hypothetical protein UFOVP147_34 [uncultured Caudovirales phage]
MTTYYVNELSGLYSLPVVKPSATTGVGGRLRRYSGSITLNTQTTADTIVVAQIPAGADFAFGVITSSVSLGTSTVAIGYAGATGAYRAAATFTATDTPTPFGVTAAVKAAPLLTEQQVFITIGVASLPASGTLVVDLYFANV